MAKDLFNRYIWFVDTLTQIIEAMRGGRSLEMKYKSFWRQSEYETIVARK